MSKSGRGVAIGAGAGDQWVKPGDWELGDHVTEHYYFNSKLRTVGEGLLEVLECILSRDIAVHGGISDCFFTEC